MLYVFRVRDSSGKPAAQRGLETDSPTRGTRGTPKLYLCISTNAPVAVNTNDLLLTTYH